jgi:hypothetical protein
MSLITSWFLASSSAVQRALVNWPPSWPIDEVVPTRNKIDPDLYTRKILENKLVKLPGCTSVCAAYDDAVREALASGVLVVDPPFPAFTEAAAAKKEVFPKYGWALAHDGRFEVISQLNAPLNSLPVWNLKVPEKEFPVHLRSLMLP